jgi:hypothetical protein
MVGYVGVSRVFGPHARSRLRTFTVLLTRSVLEWKALLKDVCRFTLARHSLVQPIRDDAPASLSCALARAAVMTDAAYLWRFAVIATMFCDTVSQRTKRDRLQKDRGLHACSRTRVTRREFNADLSSV